MILRNACGCTAPDKAEISKCWYAQANEDILDSLSGETSIAFNADRRMESNEKKCKEGTVTQFVDRKDKCAKCVVKPKDKKGK